MAVISRQEARSEARDRDNILARDKGRRRLFEHKGPRGTGGNTLGIRGDNQTPDTGGRASYLKQEEKVSDFSK